MLIKTELASWSCSLSRRQSPWHRLEAIICKNRSFSFLTCSFVFQKVCGLVYWPCKSQKQMERSWPSGHVSVSSLLSRFGGQQEGAQHADFQLTRAGYGSSCKHFSFRQRGNFSTSGGWCCANCSYFRGTFFFHMWILGQSKIFLLGILGLPSRCCCCTEILWVLQAFCGVPLRWLREGFHI